MDLSSLSPEEIEVLKDALAQHGNSSPTVHGDIEDDKKFLEPIVTALEMLTQSVEELQEKFCYLEKVVMDDIIGGVKGLYDDNVRTMGISELKGKYSEMFEPLVPAWKQMSETEDDIYEKLYDIVNELKGKEDYTDEFGDSELKGIAEKLKGKIEGIKGLGSQAEVAPEPIVEIEAKGSPDKLAMMLDKIKQSKERNKGVSVF